MEVTESQDTERQDTLEEEKEQKHKAYVSRLREEMKNKDNKVLHEYFMQKLKSQKARKLLCCRALRRSYLKYGQNFEKKKKFALMTEQQQKQRIKELNRKFIAITNAFRFLLKLSRNSNEKSKIAMAGIEVNDADDFRNSTMILEED